MRSVAHTAMRSGAPGVYYPVLQLLASGVGAVTSRLRASPRAAEALDLASAHTVSQCRWTEVGPPPEPSPHPTEADHLTRRAQRPSPVCLFWAYLTTPSSRMCLLQPCQDSRPCAWLRPTPLRFPARTWCSSERSSTQPRAPQGLFWASGSSSGPRYLGPLSSLEMAFGPNGPSALEKSENKN